MKPRVEFHQNLPPARCGCRWSAACRPACFHPLLVVSGAGCVPPFRSACSSAASRATCSSSSDGGSSSHQSRRQHAIDESRVQPARHKIRVLQHAAEKGDIGANALDFVFTQSPPQARDGLRAVRRPHGKFREQRIVFQRHLPAFVHSAVKADARPGRHLQPRDEAGRGEEVVGGVFGVNAALDGRAAHLHVLLPPRQRRSPAAIRICSFTRSMPVTNSVTGCSTCNRVFISRK